MNTSIKRIPIVISACLFIFSILIVSWKEKQVAQKKVLKLINANRDAPQALEQIINQNITEYAAQGKILESVQYGTTTIPGGTYYSAILVFENAK